MTERVQIRSEWNLQGQREKIKKKRGKNRIKLKVRKALICVFKGRHKETFFKISFVNVSI